MTAYDVANRRYYIVDVGDPEAQDTRCHHPTRLTDGQPDEERLGTSVESHIEKLDDGVAFPPA